MLSTTTRTRFSRRLVQQIDDRDIDAMLTGVSKQTRTRKTLPRFSARLRQPRLLERQQGIASISD